MKGTFILIQMPNTMPDTPRTIRSEVNNNDPEHVHTITTSVGFFNEEEIAIAVELINDKLQQ